MGVICELLKSYSVAHNLTKSRSHNWDWVEQSQLTSYMVMNRCEYVGIVLDIHLTSAACCVRRIAMI
jgi:hypothetical protein